MSGKHPAVGSVTALEDTLVHQGRFLAYYNRSFRDRAGNLQTWEMVKRRVHGDIVAVAAVTRERELILNRIYRVPLRAWVLELPAGLADKEGESSEDLARRELVEETGYDVERLELIMRGPFNTGLSADQLAIFGGQGAFRVGEPQLEPAEDIQVLRVPVADVERILVQPPAETMVDIKLFGILWWLQRAVG